MFAALPAINQKFILDKMSTPSPAEIVSTGNVASETAAPEVVSMEAPAPVPTVPRSPRPKPTPTRETQPAKSNQSTKDKQKKPVPVHASPRKHTETQKQKKDKQSEIVVDLEAEEDQGTKDIDAEWAKPITRLHKYIPPRKGKEKVTKDQDSEKFTISRFYAPAT